MASRLRISLLALGALLLVLLCAAGWLLATESGARWAVGQIAGGPAELQGVHGRLWGGLQADRIIIRQKAQTITLDKVVLAWEPAALFRRELHVTSLEVGRITVTAKVDAAPEPLRAPASLAIPLQLRIDRIGVTEGELRWGPLNVVKLGGFVLQGGFDGRQWQLRLNQFAASGMSGATAVSADLNGALTVDAAAPFALKGELSSGGSTTLPTGAMPMRGKLLLDGSLQAVQASLDFALGEARLEGKALLQPFAEKPLANADIRARAIDFSAWRADLPHTNIHAQLTASAQDAGRLTLQNDAAAPWDKHGLPLRSMAVSARQLADRVQFDSIEALFSGGSMRGAGSWQGGKLLLDLRLADLDLQRLDGRMRATSLDGRVELSHANGRQQVEIDLHEPVGKQEAGLKAKIAIAEQRIDIERAELAIASARVNAAGHVELDGKESFAAKGTVRALRLQDFGRFATMPQLTLNGSFSMNGTRAPQLAADIDFKIADSRLAGQALQGQGNARLRADRLQISQLMLSAGENSLQAKGELAKDAGQLAFSIAAPRLEQLGQGFGGAFDLQGEARGGFARPNVKLQWKTAKLSAPGGVRIEESSGTADAQIDQKLPAKITALTLDASLRGLQAGAQKVAAASAHILAGSAADAPLKIDIDAQGLAAPSLSAESLTLTGRGSTARHTLQAVLREGAQKQQWQTELAGGLSQQKGGWRWSGTLNRFEATGKINARLAAPASLAVDARRLELAGLRIDSGSARLMLDSFVRDENGIASRGRLTHAELAQLLKFSAAQPALSTDLVLDGEWDIRLADTLSGSAAIRRSSGDVIMRGGAPVALGLRTLEASASAGRGGIALRLLAEGQSLGRIRIDANAGATSRANLNTQTSVSGSASIAIPSLSWLGPLVSPAVLTEGSLASEIAVSGTLGDPRLAGRIAGHKLRLFLGDQGLDFVNGELDGELRGDTLQLQRLAFSSAGGGTLNASGALHLAEGKPGAEIKVQASHYQLLNRSDRKLVLNGEALFDWRAERAKISGELVAESGYFDIGRQDTPQLSDDVVIAGGPRREAPPLIAAVDLKLDLGENLRIEGRGLSAKLAGQLRLAGEVGGILRAQGSVQARDGTFTAYGRKLAIEQGALRFNGPLNNPALDILAMRRGQEVEAGVAVRGTVLAPRVSLVSEPNVAEADKLSWLVLGRALDAAGDADLGQLQSAAGALLSEGAAAGVQGKIASAFGLDEFRVGRSTQDNLQQRIVTIGKRISNRLYVSFQQNLQATGSIILLRYTLTPRLSVEVEAGTRSAISLLYNISFD